MQRESSMQRRMLVRAVVAVLCCGVTIGVPTTARGEILSKASTSRSTKEDAIRRIPFRSLSAPAQQRIAAVVKKPTMFRRMPITMIDCDPELHQFSIRHPEIIVSIWQLMGITKVTASRTGPYMLRCDDGVGTVTNMELIYGDNDTHVLFCEGAYEGPLFRKPLTGRCVLVLRSGAVKSSTGYKITNMMDVFLQVDHTGLDIFTKTLHPLLGKSADINFTESMRFVEKMSQAAANNGEGMQHMTDRLQDVDPEVRKNFRKVVANVNERHVAIARQNATPTPTTKLRTSARPLIRR